LKVIQLPSPTTGSISPVDAILRAMGWGPALAVRGDSSSAAVALASAPTNERLPRATLRRVPLDCTLDSTFKRHR
jgi:hypothetical protein